jgi:hypothetical protein
MGLRIKLSAEEQENSFYVFDCTGNGSTGYGNQNPKISDIIESKLYVQGPSDTSEYPWVIDVFGSIPNDKGIAYEVLPVEIGQAGGQLESGLYKLKLVHKILTKSNQTIERTGYETVVFINNIACCIDGRTPNLDDKVASDEKQMLTADLNIMLEGVKIHIDKGLYEKANQTIDYMKQQCKCSGC